MFSFSKVVLALSNCEIATYLYYKLKFYYCCVASLAKLLSFLFFIFTSFGYLEITCEVATSVVQSFFVVAQLFCQKQSYLATYLITYA